MVSDMMAMRCQVKLGTSSSITIRQLLKQMLSSSNAARGGHYFIFESRNRVCNGNAIRVRVDKKVADCLVDGLRTVKYLFGTCLMDGYNGRIEFVLIAHHRHPALVGLGM